MMGAAVSLIRCMAPTSGCHTNEEARGTVSHGDTVAGAFTRRPRSNVPDGWPNGLTSPSVTSAEIGGHERRGVLDPRHRLDEW
jgi:hypothetical protein